MKNTTFFPIVKALKTLTILIFPVNHNQNKTKSNLSFY
jgi:hypothetical protein